MTHQPLHSSWNLVRMWSIALVITLNGLSASKGADGPLGKAPAVQVPEGFEATLYADDDLAHDIHSLTIDSQGRVAVSGPGYVRFLIDQDKDGKADRFEQFADGPATGAQGLYFDGHDLICTGDAGLIRYTDQDGDDRADGPAETLLRIKTGGEHHAHSVQKGPDGWWYVVVGNMTGLTEASATIPTSPIKRPVAGAILRLRPDFSGTEVFADGYRNPYDFAFSRQGDILVFDSDGEREVTLPWYQPTRVFLALAGSSAGWSSLTWKRPNYFPDIAPVVAELGRGSPTGVVSYQHSAFPAEYDNTLFVADWTFGRVCAVPLEPSGSVCKGQPRDFMTGTGHSGFAPTDLAVGADGALYVSVGGRGTRGGVYRVVWKKGTGETPVPTPTDPDESLRLCLEAPQPLSSWSRARWLPQARALSRDPFLNAARDPKRTPAARQRAIEIVTELFGGFDSDSIRHISSDESRDVRARLAWSTGRVGLALKDPDAIQHLIRDDDPVVARCCLEALAGASPETRLAPHFEILIKHSRSRDKFVMQSAARVFARLAGRDREWFEVDYEVIDGKTWPLIGRRRVPGDLGLSRLSNRRQAEERLYFVRQAQLLLGDVGPGEPSAPELFDGYSRPNQRTFPQPEIDLARRRIAEIYPTGQAQVDWELARLIAMVQPPSPELLDHVLAKITSFSHPTSDVHHLIVAARIPTPRNDDQRDRIATALLGLEPKAQDQKLHLDTQWDPRIKELYNELVRHDFKLPNLLLKQAGFGHPGHVKFASKLSDEDLKGATETFLARVQADPRGWSNELVYLLGRSKTPEHVELLRQQIDNHSVRNAVLIVLARHPLAVDRDRYLAGLGAAQHEVLSSCLDALEKLPASQDAKEQVALVRALRRFGTDRSEYPLRDRVAKLLQRNTGQDFGFKFGKAGYEPQSDSVARWTEWLTETYPEEAETNANSAPDLSQLQSQLEPVAWTEGNAVRGESLFQTRACAQCHNHRSSLGPDLTGVTTRFSREDLFAAIAMPNQDVSPRYQTTLVSTTTGKVHTGLIIYESVDGVTLLDATNQMVRLPANEIEEQRPVNISLMPEGLLKNLAPTDLADLYAYLAKLQR